MKLFPDTLKASFLTRLFVCCLSVFCILSSTAFASLKQTVQRKSIESVVQQLQVDRERNSVTETKLKELEKLNQSKWSKVTSDTVTAQDVEAKLLAVTVAKADLVNATQVFQDITHQLEETEQRVNQLQESIQDARVSVGKTVKPDVIERSQAELEFLTSYRDILQKRHSEVSIAVDLAKRIVSIESEVYEQLLSLYQQQQNRLREQELIKLNASIQAQRTAILAKLHDYNRALQGITLQERERSPEAISLDMDIFIAEEQLYQADLKLAFAKVDDEIADIQALLGTSSPVQQLDHQLRDTDSISAKLENLIARISAKQGLIKTKRAILKQSLTNGVISQSTFKRYDERLANLSLKYNNMAQFADQLVRQLKEIQKALGNDLTKTIAKRQHLPGFDASAWQNLGRKMTHLPGAIANAFMTLIDHVYFSLKNITQSTLGFLVLLELIWLLLAYYIGHYNKQILQHLAETSSKTTANLMYALLRLIQQNSLSLLFVALVITGLVVLQVPFKSYRFFIFLSLTWFIFRFIFGIARIALLERISDASGDDVRLYHRVKWACIVGGTITAITVLAHQLSVDYEVRDVANRFFMLFLLGLSVILYRNRKVIPTLLKPILNTKRYHLERAIKIFFTLAPLTVFFNAVIGLIGYVQLAWVMSYYQIVVITILLAYIILRGVLVDSLEFMADVFIRYLQNGWLWTQAILKPLDRVLRILLFLGAVFMLFYAFGWDRDSAPVQRLSTVFTYSLFSFSGGQISLLIIIEFVVLVAIIFWLARWMREFAYRWVFVSIKDVGIRYSVSIFSQYLVVALGAIFTLQILGLDFSGLSYILGGLAVGLGFGLRDFANNIVSGIMILIERPVREGDLVTVGSYEGRVTHIGLRSMIVKSWDHMEVMVPNAETLNKSFTNWTHQDDIVRTVIPIKVHRNDDPNLVCTLLEAVLKDTDEVLSDPAPQVYMKALDDVLILFEVRYFINIKHHSRVKTRSKVLFSIWETCKEHGIRAPYPQQSVELIQ